jgi:glycosyltransferase involved in cell wall biosynthesis
MEVTGLELSAVDDTYAWTRVRGPDVFRRVTLFHERSVRREPHALVVRRIHEALDEVGPEAVALPGWSKPAALAALDWCMRRRVPGVMMSESTRHDAPRFWWLEALKGSLVNLCPAALAGGTAQAAYLMQLGMPPGRIYLGYDVVDNEHFRRGAEAARAEPEAYRERLGLPTRFFLACGRFIPEKNLPTLLRAFGQYHAVAGADAWHLVLLGEGVLRPDVERLRAELGLEDQVLMPGFKQYEDLPAYYGLAGAFVHASTVEPWGLVVNEAMAAGLPVLVSRQCGCAPDLVKEGRNGHTFDARDLAGLARLLGQLSRPGVELAAMGTASRDIIQEWSPERFGTGLRDAVEAALQHPGVRPTRRAGFLVRRLALRADVTRWTLSGAGARNGSGAEIPQPHAAPMAVARKPGGKSGLLLSRLPNLPLWRALKWRSYVRMASVRSRLPLGRLNRPPVFIVGCGRSGTTILGRIIGCHGRLVYLNEPIHYWYAIDARTDNIDFFGGKGLCFLGAEDATDQARLRFGRLFGQAQLLAGADALVEKFPTNALRMEWISALCPGARFIHVVRDGRSVCKSIALLSDANRYKVLAIEGLNQWWGKAFHKWKTLAREGLHRRLYMDALGELGGESATDYLGMAVYEWLVSLDQVYAAVARLKLGADRFFEMRYEELVARPEQCLRRIEEFIDVGHDERLLEAARIMLVERGASGFDLALPPSLHGPFVEHQGSLHYPVEGVRAASGKP